MTLEVDRRLPEGQGSRDAGTISTGKVRREKGENLFLKRRVGCSLSGKSGVRSSKVREPIYSREGSPV